MYDTQLAEIQEMFTEQETGTKIAVCFIDLQTISKGGRAGKRRSQLALASGVVS